MTETIVVSVPELGDEGMRRLEASGTRVLFVSAEGGQEELGAILAREPVDALILRTLKLDGAAIRSCPTLKVISRHGAGFNGVDVETATELGIPVYIAPAANSQSVAELTIGLLLAVARDLNDLTKAFGAGEWRTGAVGIQLAGKTLGLLGFGAIGRKVAAIAAAIGMEIVVHDKFVAPDQLPDAVTLCHDFDVFMARLDILSIHVPATRETIGLVDALALSRMRPGGIVINTARGEILREADLIAALDAGHLAGAGLDTLASEPPGPDHPLANRPGVVITPHIGGSTVAALNSVAAIAVDNALGALRGPMPDRRLCINPTVLKG